MSRSLFMLLTGAYGLLLTVVMLFTPEAAIRNYGAPELNLNHIAVMQFLGLSTGATALMTLLNRNAPNSYTLRTLLLAQALLLVGGVALGVYHATVVHVPMNSFFMGDSLFRLLLGLGFTYFYTRESKLAQGGAMAV
jgi:hypothetical protein